MKLYICGPVSLGGTCTPEQELENLRNFHVVEEMLRKARFNVESPACIQSFCAQELNMALPGDSECPSEGLERWQWFMRRTIIQMLTCNGVATLDRVEESSGCITEMRLAKLLGLPIKNFRRWLADADATRP